MKFCKLNIIHRLDKQKINQRKNVNIFLPISFNMCFGAQKNRIIEAVLLNTQQHMFLVRNKKIKFSLRTLKS